MPFFYIALPDWTFKPTFEFRERFERRIDKDVTESKNDNKSDLYSRYRIGIDFKNRAGISGRVAYQYAHDLSWQKSANAGKINSDLLEAFIVVPTEAGKLKTGRQIFSMGSERLLGGGDYGNNGRSWNMVRFTNSQWEAWMGQLAANGSPSKEALLGGLSFKSKAGYTMLIYKHDNASGTMLDVYTVDHRWTRSTKKLSYDFEVAGQAGRSNSNPLLAWAGVGRISYTMNPKTTAYVEGNVASGGKHGNTVLTFDQLYANNHGRLGIADAQGWRNVKALAIGVTFNPTKKLCLTAEYDRFGLWAANDAWYADGGKPNKTGSTTFTDPTGSKGTDLGDEFDVCASFKLDAKTMFETGIGVFRPGRYQRAFVGAGDRNHVWGYFQYRLRF